MDKDYNIRFLNKSNIVNTGGFNVRPRIIYTKSNKFKKIIGRSTVLQFKKISLPQNYPKPKGGEFILNYPLSKVKSNKIKVLDKIEHTENIYTVRNINHLDLIKNEDISDIIEDNHEIKPIIKFF